MVDLAIWAFADVLTVEQAACLWVGSDPAADPHSRSPDEVTNIAAINQTLSGAIAMNSLVADSSRNVLASIGDYSKSLVTRRALQLFAESKGERPRFLFDTLFIATETPVLPSPTEAPAPNKGGRPAEYDWDAFMIEIIRIADLDALPETQSELISTMLNWCEQTWGKQPAESSVKARISRIYNGLGRGRKPEML
jgi:hypothetical protein